MRETFAAAEFAALHEADGNFGKRETHTSCCEHTADTDFHQCFLLWSNAVDLFSFGERRRALAEKPCKSTRHARFGQAHSGCRSPRSARSFGGEKRRLHWWCLLSKALPCSRRRRLGSFRFMNLRMHPMERVIIANSTIVARVNQKLFALGNSRSWTAPVSYRMR
jgi:hypothetical protein